MDEMTESLWDSSRMVWRKEVGKVKQLERRMEERMESFWVSRMVSMWSYDGTSLGLSKSLGLSGGQVDGVSLGPSDGQVDGVSLGHSDGLVDGVSLEVVLHQTWLEHLKVVLHQTLWEHSKVHP